jgi:hypothetical protein
MDTMNNAPLPNVYMHMGYVGDEYHRCSISASAIDLFRSASLATQPRRLSCPHLKERDEYYE